MNELLLPTDQDTTTVTLLAATFTEVCERVIYVRALLDDPRLETKRQGSAVASMLRAGLHSVERQLQAVRPVAFHSDAQTAPSAIAGIGMAMAGLRQVHAHLSYLGSRWPLGTTDLFVRKLIAEGAPVPVPTLCPADRYDEAIGELGTSFQERLRDIGLSPRRQVVRTPVLTLPTMDLLDPLSWAALLHDLAAVVVSTEGMAGRLRRPTPDSAVDDDGYRRACVASVATRLIGEPTVAACALQTLLARICGRDGCSDLQDLFQAGAAYGQPLAPNSEETLGAWLAGLLRTQAGLGGWGRSGGKPVDPVSEPRWPEIEEFVRATIPAPLLPDAAAIETLYQGLCDGRPINAYSPSLSPLFSQQLEAAVDADRFYAMLDQANERPCSLATILTVGWRYKLRRSYVLCVEIMGGSTPWQEALDTLASHVLERCALLQQSIEAAYVQQVFARWRDQ